MKYTTSILAAIACAAVFTSCGDSSPKPSAEKRWPIKSSTLINGSDTLKIDEFDDGVKEYTLNGKKIQSDRVPAKFKEPFSGIGGAEKLGGNAEEAGGRESL